VSHITEVEELRIVSVIRRGWVRWYGQPRTMSVRGRQNHC